MSTPPLSELRRRRDLLLLAGAGVFLALAASPLAALAQTAPRDAPLKIGTIGAGREGSSDVHCALIQFFDPVSLTATFEKKKCTGVSSALL